MARTKVMDVNEIVDEMRDDKYVYRNCLHERIDLQRGPCSLVKLLIVVSVIV